MRMRSCFSSAAIGRGVVRLGSSTMLLMAGVPVLSGSAHAQAIAVVVNGDPVTNIDIEQRMKLLRAIHRPASRDAAVESMISDRLMLREASHDGLTIRDNEIGEQLVTDAAKLKTTPQQLLADLEHAGVQKEHYVAYFKAELGYSVLIKALNKGVEASEVAVRAELAKSGGKSSITEYRLRPVVFTLDPGETPVSIGEKAKKAEALRSRFTSCEAGVDYAKSLPGVAVREMVTRTSTVLTPQTKELLDKTPMGHLTPMSRTTSGLEMIAVCGRGAATDDTELRKSISDKLLQAHIDQEAATKLKDMRQRAVIEKR